MQCFICKKELTRVRDNWWKCPQCHNEYPTESYLDSISLSGEKTSDEH